jgi:hypothetical protein
LKTYHVFEPGPLLKMLGFKRQETEVQVLKPADERGMVLVSMPPPPENSIIGILAKRDGVKLTERYERLVPQSTIVTKEEG